MNSITDTVKVLLIVNILFFIGANTIGAQGYDLLALWFPKNDNFQIWQLLTHMFMHGSLMHIAFNMYALYAFGSPIEQVLGKNKFIFFYFSAGLGAAALHLAWNYYQFQTGYQAYLAAGMASSDLNQMLLQLGHTGQYRIFDSIPAEVSAQMVSSYMSPAVGASGAIYGILVAFAFTFPETALFLMFVPIPIKAKYFVPVLIGIDLFSGFTGQSIFGGSIAHFAHVGGALLGFIMIWYWKKNSFNQNRWDL